MDLLLTSGSHFCGRGKPPTPSGMVDPAGWGTAQPSKGPANETEIALILLIFTLFEIFSSVLLHKRSQISPLLMTTLKFVDAFGPQQIRKSHHG